MPAQFFTVPGVVLQINASRGGGHFDPHHVLSIKRNGFLRVCKLWGQYSYLLYVGYVVLEQEGDIRDSCTAVDFVV